MKNAENWQPSIYAVKESRLEVIRKNVSPSSWLPCSLIANTFSTLLPKYCSGCLLDLGCGKVPYYGLYHHYVDKVTCVDWANSYHENPHLDLVQDLNQPLQLESNTFDTVLLTDVLEHVSETDMVITEVSRVLQPGGRFIVSVPFLYWLHEVPYDNYRFTCYGLTHKLEKFGFEVEELIVHGSWGAVLTDLLSKGIGRVPLLGNLLVRNLQRATIWYFCRKNRPPKWHDLKNAFPLGYVCVAKKRTLGNESS